MALPVIEESSYLAYTSEVILLTQLGRVATLIDDPDSASHGMAFRLKDTTAASALEYLNMRESKYNFTIY